MVSVLFVKFIEVVTAEPKVTPTPIQIKIKIQLIFVLIFWQLFTACWMAYQDRGWGRIRFRPTQ
jgi:hypothetical protein